MPERIVVRGFRPEDDEALRSIWLEALAEGSLPGTEAAEVGYLVERLHVDPSSFALATLDGDVSGLLHVDAHMIAVAREQRRRGVARALVRHVLNDPSFDRLLLWLPEGNDTARACYVALGLTYQMSFWQLDLSSQTQMDSPGFPDSLEQLTVDLVDVEAYVSLFNEAFIDHPTPVRLTPELVDWAHSLPGFDATLVLVLRERAKGELIGFCRVGIQGDTGELKFIGLLPQWRGRGLGRALLSWAVQRTRSAGARNVTLTVEGENESALSLYQRAGFAATREWRRYGKSRS